MKRSRLSCFQNFRCLAGACPDTCCAGWEIDLDEKILEIYAGLPGALGEEVRSAIREEDGYTFFACRDGRCPFLNEQNLCRLILDSIGRGQPEEALLSEVCREHPRFYDAYGALTETSLAISCPEAARLLLQQAPVQVRCEDAGEDGTPEDDPDLDEALLEMLLAGRERFFRIAESEAPFALRLQRLMQAAASLQDLVDNRCFGDAEESAALPALPETWQPDLRAWLRVMEQLEFTDDRLPQLMQTCTEQADAAGETSETVYPVFPETLLVPLQNLLVYFLYRYVPRAVWDEDVLGKVGLAVRSAETIAYLARLQTEPDADALQEAAIRYSREVEHSDENLSRLYDEVWKEYLGQ